jgi:uncharacterized protein YndB with AHSA1/START domain
MVAQQSEVVEREVVIGARAETIFSFFTDPEKMMRWMGIEVELEPVPGGSYRVNVNGRDIARGEYREIDPPHRVVMTWGWEAEGNPVPPGSSTVEVTLTPEGEGTRVRLRHLDLPEGAREPHAHGWEHYWERLALAAAGSDPGPDPWADPAAHM